MSSISEGISEWIGKALDHLGVSPLAGRAYGPKSDEFGSHPLHQKDVLARAGVDPFHTAQWPTSKTPIHVEAERLGIDVATMNAGQTNWVSLFSPFFFFPFFQTAFGVVGITARARFYRKFADTVRT